MNMELQNILNLEWCERRKEKSKYFTEEFFEKYPTKYRDLIEKYEIISFQINTLFKSKNKEIKDFYMMSLDFRNEEIERIYNYLLDYQDWLEKSSEEIINEIKQEINDLELKEKWDENFENIQEEIEKIGNKIIDEYGETVTWEELSSPISKELKLLCEIRNIYFLNKNLKILKFIPINANDNTYDAEYGYNYLLLGKKTGKIYRLDGVESNHRPTLEKIAENFDEFMERLYLGNLLDFEDDNDYEEILRNKKE